MVVTNKHVVAGGIAGISAAGAILAATLIPHWEGRDLVAKHNFFDPKGVITVCDGVTNYDLPTLKAGQVFTPEQCDALLLANIPKYAAPVQKCVPSFQYMSPHRQAALVSFAYNLGPGRICNSTIGRDLNAGNIEAACNAMTQYVRADGKVLKGLVNRRTDGMWGERAWCLRED